MSVACDVEIKEEIKEEPLNFGEENGKDDQLVNEASNLTKYQTYANPIEAIFLPENIKEEKLDEDVESEQDNCNKQASNVIKPQLSDNYVKGPSNSPDDSGKAFYHLDTNRELRASKDSPEPEEEIAFASTNNFQSSLYDFYNKRYSSSIDADQTSSLGNTNAKSISESALNCRSKRKAKKSGFKIVLAKSFQSLGREHISASKPGEVIKERVILPPCPPKCRLGCSNKFSYNQRREIFNCYWKLDNEKQQAFIIENIEIVNPKYRYIKSVNPNKPRSLNNAYYFYKDKEKIRVCKSFFKNTLGITLRSLERVLKIRPERNICFQDEEANENFVALKKSDDELGKNDNVLSPSENVTLSQSENVILSQSENEASISSEHNSIPFVDFCNESDISSDCVAQTLTPGSSCSVTSIYESVFVYDKEREVEVSNRITNIAKQLRNFGKEYTSATKSKKLMKEREIRPPCGVKCRLGCSNKFTDVQRRDLFNFYWNLGDIEKQRTFIVTNMETIKPRYRYVRSERPDKPRGLNHAFYFFKGEQRVRVCKFFFKNTLGINDRPIRTVLDKILSGDTFEDHRGKYKKKSD